MAKIVGKKMRGTSLAFAALVASSSIAASALAQAPSPIRGDRAIFLFGDPNLSTGAVPYGNLLLGADGNLYGTASDFLVREKEMGKVFRLEPPASGPGLWHETILHTFVNRADGARPFVGVVAGTDGALYGTTKGGGAADGGTAYRLAPLPDGGKWIFSVIYSFHRDGGVRPLSPLLAGPDGSFFGTLNSGGKTPCRCGTVFQLLPPGPGGSSWTEKVLYTFGKDTMGAPAGSLVTDASGALYGVTGWYGPKSGGYQFLNDVAYKLSPPRSGQGAWVFEILHRFTGYPLDGDTLEAGMVWGLGGSLYGTAAYGGSANNGIAFQLTPPASGTGPWTETVLHNFGTHKGLEGGVSPASDLLLRADGSLLGTANAGGEGGSSSGLVFSLSPPSPGRTTWIFKAHAALSNGDGYDVSGGLTPDGRGGYAGNSPAGGYSFGTVYDYVPPVQ